MFFYCIEINLEKAWDLLFDSSNIFLIFSCRVKKRKELWIVHTFEKLFPPPLRNIPNLKPTQKFKSDTTKCKHVAIVFQNLSAVWKKVQGVGWGGRWVHHLSPMLIAKQVVMHGQWNFHPFIFGPILGIFDWYNRTKCWTGVAPPHPFVVRVSCFFLIRWHILTYFTIL